ncbi:MAG: DUF3418 domain-containing protein [Actinomycetota bacterium]|nr:DUF3418 domain-containing protein [Actinomycetota bacterium]
MSHPEQLPAEQSAAPTAPPVNDLRERLTQLTLADEHRLGRRLEGIRSMRAAGKRDKGFREIAGLVQRAEQKIAKRRAAVPTISYPDLPVADRAEDLAAVIAANQVVIVAGETGSGKSTQLPKICLQLGRGVRGLIGHTQPRRIAARALAERIAEETGTQLGDAIGYTIRFGDHTGANTLVKLMTDGILLAEIGRDRLLSNYDTIIIDEAHERSLNIDFLLGYLTELLPRRPDLKLIITSATIDPQRFSRHFGDAPIVEVSGRTYPVEIRYRPYGPDEDSDDDVDTDDADDADDPANKPNKPTKPTKPAKSTLTPNRPAGKGRADPGTVDQATAICQAVDELATQGDGDVLVFLSGEREITDTAEVLRGHLAGRAGAATEVLPLYGRLSVADQHRVFSEHSRRRIVLATNVAETSLTVPGIRYVIDPGTARISRYSTRTKVQRLPIEKISQASAGQRAGRCGRVADGICIRLYSESDFQTRPEFTEPEIARTSLAAVILQMASLGLGDIASFPFVEPPDTRQITDGVRVLDELGALDRSAADSTVRLTAIGRSLAALPLDPQFARMIVEANTRGCLAEVLVITAALAIQDVREYPLEERDKATASHSRFTDPNSDFLAIVNLWHYLGEQANALSGNAFRRMCRTEYLHYLRIREWQDLHAQLRQVARSLGMDTNRSAADSDGPTSAPAPKTASKRRGKGSSAFAAAKAAAEAVAEATAAASETTGGSGKDAAQGTRPGRKKSADQQGKGSAAVGVDTEAVHTALLSGLLSHIGQKLEPGREYQGTRGTKFVLWPGSSLAKAGPRFVMAAELVETSRLWGRMVAKIDPLWAEKVGEHLVKRSYSEPRWDARRGAVVGTERATLLGVVLTAARTIQFDRIDPELARELFIRHALVEGDWDTHHPWFAANQDALDEVAQREDRVRRRDIVIDDETLFAMYAARIPAEVTSGRHLDSWWRKESKAQPDLLTFSPDMLIAAESTDVSEDSFLAAYPDRFTSGGVDLDLDYVFDPAREDDGVVVTIPLPVLARVDPAAFQAQIPGLRSDLAVALLRTLPKTLRRNFVPAPDFATVALSRIEAATADSAPQPADGDRGLPAALAGQLTALTGIVVRATDFDLDKLPDHLRMTFKVVAADGTTVATGKDLLALQESLRSTTREAVAAAVSDTVGGVEQRGLTEFPHDGVPREIVRQIDGHQVRAYPALVDDGTSVAIKVFTSTVDQARAMRSGTRRLLVLGTRNPLGYLRYQLTRDQLMTLATAPHGSLAGLVDDAMEAAVDALLDWAGGPAWDAAAFATLAAKLAPHLDKATGDIVTAAETALRSAHRAELAVEQVQGAALAAAAIDMRSELAVLVHPGFITATTAAHLPDLDRYLQALATRAERARQNPDRDRERMAEVLALGAELQDAIAGLRVERRTDADVRDVRRMLEEFRVAQFAQPMRTAIPVSGKRIQSAIAGLHD